MASLAHIIQQVRQARRDVAPPTTRRFEAYKPQYAELLEAVDTLGGTEPLDELAAWMIDRTHETGHLPEPTAVRTQARTICLDHGIDIPANSPLHR